MRVGGHTSRIGLAISEDGINFERVGAPVLYPAEDAELCNELRGGWRIPGLFIAMTAHT